NRSRCTETEITGVVLLLCNRGNITQHQTRHIEQGKIKMTYCAIRLHKNGFQCKTKVKECHHIKQQVHPIRMDDTTSKDGVKLGFVPINAVRVEHHPRVHVRIRSEEH